MIIQFKKWAKQAIACQRRHDLDKRLDMLAQVRIVEGPAAKKARLELSKLRNQDWKTK